MRQVATNEPRSDANGCRGGAGGRRHKRALGSVCRGAKQQQCWSATAEEARRASSAEQEEQRDRRWSGLCKEGGGACWVEMRHLRCAVGWMEETGLSWCRSDRHNVVYTNLYYWKIHPLTKTMYSLWFGKRSRLEQWHGLQNTALTSLFL
jgi:hypothetical protein